MSGAEDGAAALRSSAAYLEPEDVALIEIGGPGAFDALDRLLPCDLFAYDGQARRTVLLADDASVLADVLLAKLDDAWTLLVDGLSFDAVASLVREAGGPGVAVSLHDRRDDCGLLSLHGPFAWELAGQWLGQRVVNMPPLSVLRVPPVTVLRAGRTGEFGYEVLVPRAALVATRARLLEAGVAFDLAPATRAGIERCAIENGDVPRSARTATLSPIELQLQWRTSRKKSYRGREALDRRRATATQRVAWFQSDAPIPLGAPVLEDGDPRGWVLASAPSTVDAGRAVGVALLEREVSHPGLDFVGAHGAAIRTASPPLVAPSSRQVRPHIDRYATRDAERFPRGR